MSHSQLLYLSRHSKMDKVQAANKVTEMFGSERNELKLGRSFYKNKEGAFHTIRYDFKPASIDHSKAASLDMKDGSEVNISFPNDESKGGPSSTNFKGPMKPCQKDCVLIYDHRSGEFTLERLTSNINVKIQRLEGRRKGKPPAAKPSTVKPNTAQLKKKPSKKTKHSIKPRPEPSKVERELVRDLSPPSKFEREPVRDLSPPSKFEREPVRDLSPPSVSPPRAQRPPTPDAAITRTLSEDSSPEPAPVSRSLSQESSSEEEEEEEEEEREEVEEEERRYNTNNTNSSNNTNNTNNTNSSNNTNNTNNTNSSNNTSNTNNNSSNTNNNSSNININIRKNSQRQRVVVQRKRKIIAAVMMIPVVKKKKKKLSHKVGWMLIKRWVMMCFGCRVV
ncbi:putative ELL-associated factor 2-like [Apostichopus japonicus]|uniref:Putative ELL-associated factor 2-like n=1 Tax=Stichopus japonicus TaxID=307972 RepID=A0A2G8LPQ1_STIJA|nr:putative ELL-associated factor 2-like [Apostichopus japonicus]